MGFTGLSGVHNMCYEFGILTAPDDKELPDSMYDMPELQNRFKVGDGGLTGLGGDRKVRKRAPLPYGRRVAFVFFSSSPC